MRYTPQIVEGVMDRVLSEIGRVACNTQQPPWGPHWGDAPFRAIECGPVSVRIKEYDCDVLMTVCAFGFEVATWVDSKRPFYHAHVPEQCTDEIFVGWARQVLKSLSGQATDACKPAIPPQKDEYLPR